MKNRFSHVFYSKSLNRRFLACRSRKTSMYSRYTLSPRESYRGSPAVRATTHSYSVNECRVACVTRDFSFCSPWEWLRQLNSFKEIWIDQEIWPAAGSSASSCAVPAPTWISLQDAQVINYVCTLCARVCVCVVRGRKRYIL